MNAYVYLGLAIVSEVIATSALKASNEFTRLVPSAIVVVGYAAAFYALSKSLRVIPIGIAYAIWSGIGVTLVCLIAAVLYRQKLDLAAISGILLIIAGVIVIQLFSHSAEIR